MHIVLLALDGRLPTEIARVLFCSRTTVYAAVVSRFVREKQAAFDDRKRRGPKPSLGEPEEEYIEHLIEEEPPVEHGWLRSRWSCKLIAVELFKEGCALVSRETIRHVLHRLGFRSQEAASGPARDKTPMSSESESYRGSRRSFRWSKKRDRSSKMRRRFPRN